MSKPSPLNPQQAIKISDDASVDESQIGGQAGRDLTVAQNQGSGHIFQGVTFNVLSAQGQSRPPDLTRKAYRNRQALINKVRHYWIEGMLATAVANQGLIDLDLEDRPDALTSPWSGFLERSKQGGKPLPVGTKIIDMFDQMGEGRTLLILGDPGGGKTTLLLALVSDLIARAEMNAEYSIPVVFNLSSWTPGRHPIDRWLVNELSRKYQVPRQVGRAWVDDQQLMLFLDGLDEVQAKSREACVTALNAFNQNYGPELVICSRTQEYTQLTKRLNVQAAIGLRSLTDTQIHLATSDPQLGGLRTLVHSDQTLRELARSPLMLNLMVNAYRGIRPQDLPQMPLLEDRRQQLFATYVQQMLKYRSRNAHFTPEQILHWLSWLAKRMISVSQTMFLIEDMQPSYLHNRGQRQIYWISVKGMVMGLWGSLHMGLLAGQVGTQITFDARSNVLATVAGLLGGIVYGLVGGPLGARVTRKTSPLLGKLLNALLLAVIFGPIASWVFGLQMYGVAYGLVYAVIGFLLYGALHQQGIETAEALQWSWRRAIVTAIPGLAVGGALYLGTSNALVPSLIFGLMLALIFGFERKTDVDPTTMPNQGIWQSVANSSKLFLTIGGFTGLLLGVYVLLSGTLNPSFIVVNVLLFGLASALLGGQGAGITCLKHFVLRVILWQKGYAPWNYARFLNNAAERVLLQKVGGGYVFINRALLEYFASLTVYND